MAPATQELYVRLEGKVQGVFFRATVQKWAQQLGLTGYVRNHPDGSVEVVAQGPRAALENLKKKCYTGPDRAQVTRLRHEWREVAEKHDSFTITS